MTSRGLSLAALATAAVTIASLATVVGSANAGTAEAAPLANGAVFNNPVGTAAERTAIQTRTVELVEAAPPGSLIRVAQYYADDPTIPNALVAAKNRGVAVQVVLDGRQTVIPVWNTLVAGLGTDLAAASWVLTCPAGRGCIGNRTVGGVKSINHNKFILFSSTSGAADVVMQSTANWHNGRDGWKGWNAAMIVVGNAGIYDAYSGYFDDLKARRADNNYYDTRVPVQSGNAKVFFFPRAEAAGASVYNNPAEDTVMTILNNTECFGNRAVGTPDGTFRTIIRVNHMSLSRSYIARKLLELDRAGCDVEVVTRYDPGHSHEQQAMAYLLTPVTTGYDGPLVRYYCVADSVWTHAKYFQVEGRYYGKGDRLLTWVGSHNLSHSSLRQSDEVLLQSEDPTVFAGFRDNFTAVRDTPGIRAGTSGGTASCG